MKKCPKCNKQYDDTWGVCLSCQVPLQQIDTPSGNSTKVVEKVDKLTPEELKHLEQVRARFKRNFIIYICSVVPILPLMFISPNTELPTAVFVVPILGIFVAISTGCMLLLGIRQIGSAMKIGLGQITIVQLLCLFISPFIPAILALSGSKKVLKTGEGAKYLF